MDAKEIKEIRAKLGMSQVAFAKKLGVSAPSIARWEVNKFKPSPLAEARINALKRKIKKLSA